MSDACLDDSSVKSPWQSGQLDMIQQHCTHKKCKAYIVKYLEVTASKHVTVNNLSPADQALQQRLHNRAAPLAVLAIGFSANHASGTNSMDKNETEYNIASSPWA